MFYVKYKGNFKGQPYKGHIISDRNLQIMQHKDGEEMQLKYESNLRLWQ